MRYEKKKKKNDKRTLKERQLMHSTRKRYILKRNKK